MTKIHFNFTSPMATGSFPPRSPRSPKEMPFKLTAPCWRGWAAVDCTSGWVQDGAQPSPGFRSL